MSEHPQFFGWQRSPKLGRNFYLCCAAEKQGKRFHGVPQAVQEHCGRVGNEAWVSQVLDYSSVTKSWNHECLLDSFLFMQLLSPTWTKEWELIFGMNIYSTTLIKGREKVYGEYEQLQPALATTSCLSAGKNLSYGWLVLLFLKLYNPHWTQCPSSLG